MAFIPPPVNERNVRIAESQTDHETRTKMNVDTIHAHELCFHKTPLYQEPLKFSWDSYFKSQSSNGVVAEEIWIRGAAHLLGVDIHVSTPGVNTQNPVHKLSHRITDSENDDHAGAPFFLMGNAGNHFQPIDHIISSAQINSGRRGELKLENVKIAYFGSPPHFCGFFKLFD